MILDANARIGDAWRNRWDSLRLFTPARLDGLDGMAFPAPRRLVPDEGRDGRIPRAIREPLRAPGRQPGCASDRSRANGDRFVVDGGRPSIREPSTWWSRCRAGRSRDPGVRDGARPATSSQIHSNAYRGPHQLRPGPVLVVGRRELRRRDRARCGRSGHQTMPRRDRIPATSRSGSTGSSGGTCCAHRAARAVPRVLTVRTPIGRKVRGKMLARASR